MANNLPGENKKLKSELAYQMRRNEKLNQKLDEVHKDYSCLVGENFSLNSTIAECMNELQKTKDDLEKKTNEIEELKKTNASLKKRIDELEGITARQNAAMEIYSQSPAERWHSNFFDADIENDAAFIDNEQVKKLLEENRHLRVIIEYLRSALNGDSCLVDSDGQGVRKGRPVKISDSTRKRIILLHEQRHSVREIAKLEGISKSLVQAIISRERSKHE